jgi:ubiquinone/menaquinone biosynthesis C-methylase UbiE
MKNILFGNEIERMPDVAFRFMKIFFAIYYFLKPAGRYLLKFGIKPGDTVVDYGCGTGAFTKSTSEMVGDQGKVYAVDIHELAIESVEKVIRKHKLTNVIPVLNDGQGNKIPDRAADIVFALDMFHMVKDTDSFLKEICRITKDTGVLLLEDGHQPRKLAREKVTKAGCWVITGEEKRFIKCTPSRKTG